jgi:hypothetical protein
MRLSFAPLLLLPLTQAALAPDVFNWAADLLAGTETSAPGKEVHTFDSWRWSDCGTSRVRVGADDRSSF